MIKSKTFWFFTAYAIWGIYLMASNWNISINHGINAPLNWFVGFFIIIGYASGLGMWYFVNWWYSWHDVWTEKRIKICECGHEDGKHRDTWCYGTGLRCKCTKFKYLRNKPMRGK